MSKSLSYWIKLFLLILTALEQVVESDPAILQHVADGEAETEQ